jgi:23S rRNA pseudouridine1911/1915/1917 synthase
MRLSFSRKEKEAIPVILYEDPDLLVAVKPAGMPSQPDKLGTDDLLTYLAGLGKDGETDLKLVNRLDRPVGGIVLFTRSEAAGKWFSVKNGASRVRKEYTAVVCGRMPSPEGELTDYLLKNEKTNRSSVVPAGTPGAKKAVLRYRVTAVCDHPDAGSLSLLAIWLITGRHHQIRVQTSQAGCPVYGDTKYNPAFAEEKGWHRTALFASEMSFVHRTGKEMTFRADPYEYEPEAFSCFAKEKASPAGQQEDHTNDG